jgi:hypothetical protein
MSAPKPDTLTKVVTAIVAFLFYVPLVIWGGFVTSTVWGWFAVTLLGLPPISIAGAIGLGCVLKCFTWPIARSHEMRAAERRLGPEGEESASEAIATNVGEAFMLPAVLLLIAWITKEFFL